MAKLRRKERETKLEQERRARLTQAGMFPPPQDDEVSDSDSDSYSSRHSIDDSADDDKVAEVDLAPAALPAEAVKGDEDDEDQRQGLHGSAPSATAAAATATAAIAAAPAALAVSPQAPPVTDTCYDYRASSSEDETAVAVRTVRVLTVVPVHGRDHHPG